MGLVELKALQRGIWAGGIKGAHFAIVEEVLDYLNGVERSVFSFTIGEAIAARKRVGGSNSGKESEAYKAKQGAKTKHNAKVQHKSERKEGKCV